MDKHYIQITSCQGYVDITPGHPYMQSIGYRPPHSDLEKLKIMKKKLEAYFPKERLSIVNRFSHDKVVVEDEVCEEMSLEQIKDYICRMAKHYQNSAISTKIFQERLRVKLGQLWDHVGDLHRDKKPWEIGDVFYINPFGVEVTYRGIISEITGDKYGVILRSKRFESCGEYNKKYTKNVVLNESFYAKVCRRTESK